MAFSIGGNDGQNNATATGGRPKAVAFLNFWILRKDGTRVKLGAIPLSGEGLQGAIVKRLDEPGGLEALADHLEITYVKVNPNRGYDPGF